MTCTGCQHYQPLMEQCDPLVGVLLCRDCDIQWKPKECNPERGIGCPGCRQLLPSLDISLCPGAVPSSHCPGFELKARRAVKTTQKPVKKKKAVSVSDAAQGRLF